MKITKPFLLLMALFITGFMACKKPLDTVPDTSLTELKTFDDVRNALRGAYDGFQSNNFSDEHWLFGKIIRNIHKNKSNFVQQKFYP